MEVGVERDLMGVDVGEKREKERKIAIFYVGR